MLFILENLPLKSPVFGRKKNQNMSNNLFIVKPNESWNPFQLISQVENLIFFFKYLSPFFCSSRILGLN